MDVLRPLRAFNRFQQRHTALAIPMAVIRKFSNDQAGNLAALMAYYAFFSLFPLLLVFTTVLGFVLQGHPKLETSVENSVLGHFPVVGGQLHAHALRGKVTALVVGLLGSLWGGLGVTNAAQNAFDRIWAVPFKDRPNYLYARLRGLLLLVCLGVMFILAAGISGLVSALGGTLVIIGGIVLSLALNFGIYLAAFRFLTAATVPTRSLWLGAAVGAVFLEILQYLGSIYIKHFLSHASNTYGTFATVIGLLVWLHLTAQFTLYAAEVNVVLVRRLWPRSLFGPPHAPADQETFRALAKVEERHEVEQVDVRFAHEEQLPGNGHPQPELEQQPQPDR